MLCNLWQRNLHKMAAIYFLIYSHYSAVQRRFTILHICGAVGPCCPEQLLQLSSVNTTQTTGKFAVTTTTPPLTIGCSGCINHNFSEHDVVLLPPLILRDTVGSCWSCYCAIAATSVPDALLGLNQFCLWSYSGDSPFQS